MNKTQQKLHDDLVAHLTHETKYGLFTITGMIKGKRSEIAIESVATEVRELVTRARGAAERVRQTSPDDLAQTIRDLDAEDERGREDSSRH